MITAQDIREKTFERSKFNGYEMADVDDFLEELADDVTASQKENAVLKSKMKVLVDKIEEYRANEEALNLAVLSAQKLALQIETDARSRATQMVADADRQVKAALGSITEQTRIEEERLAQAKAATAKYFEAVRTLCNTQLKNIDRIGSAMMPETDADEVQVKEAPAPDVDEAVRSIENTVSKLQPEPSFDIDIPADKNGHSAKRVRNLDSTQPFSIQ